MARSRRRDPTWFPAALLAGCAFLPIDPGTGTSTFGIVRQALAEDWVMAAILTLTLGLPHLLGLLMCGAARGSRVARALTRAAICVLAFEATLLALLVLRAENVVGPIALLGFVLVADVLVVASLARRDRRGGFRLTRAAGALIFGVYAWLALQALHHDAFNVALSATALVGAVLALVAGRAGDRVRPDEDDVSVAAH
jgi:hypothetical protein